MVEQPMSFFLPLVERNWARVRVLDVVIFPYANDGPGVLEDRRWSTFQQPAPQLEIYNIGFHVPVSSEDSVKSLISCAQITFSLPTPPWLSHIRCLTLGYTRHLIEKLLPAFLSAGATSLERLTLIDDRDLVWLLPSHPLPYISCPHLVHLSLVNIPIRLSLYILQRIAPAPGCALMIEVYTPVSTANILSEEELSTAEAVLTRYATSYFEIRQPCQLRIEDNYWLSKITFDTTPLQLSHPAPSASGHESWPFHIVEENALVGASTFCKMLSNLLVVCMPPSVVMLDLSLLHAGTPAQFSEGTIAHSDIIRLLHELSHVIVCKTDFETLVKLDELTQKFSAAVPPLSCLKRVCLRPVENGGRYHDKNGAHAVALMFQRRLKMGFPVDVLETEHLGQKFLMDFGCFEELCPGLTIVWRAGPHGKQEYVCGSGRPERINFENILI